jgi:hypothetical protein
MSEVFFVLNVESPENGTQRFHCTGGNTELYVHAPNYRDVDHLFHRYDPEDRRLGAFVFRQILGEDEFERIRQYVFNSGAYPITYRPEPTETDFAEYLHTQSNDIDSWEG